MIEAKSDDNIKSNVGVTFKYRGDTYKKFAVKDESCDGCVTVQGTSLCDAAEDCEGIVVYKYRSWLKTFKQL